MSLAKRIEGRCKDLGLSWGDVARRLDVTRGAVGHWIHGRADPEYAKIEKLAEVLECSPMWLLFGKDPGLKVAEIPVAGWIDRGGMARLAREVAELAPMILPSSVRARIWKLRADVGPFGAGDVVYAAPMDKVGDSHAAWGRPAVVKAGSMRVLARSVMPIEDDHAHVYLYDGDHISSARAPEVWPVVASLTAVGITVLQIVLTVVSMTPADRGFAGLFSML